MYLVVGLGNPGKQYEATRHNMGFDTIDVLVERHKIPQGGVKFNAMYGKGIIGGEKAILMKPLSYMNLSGGPIQEMSGYFKIDPETELIVIYDDIDLEPGQLRIRKKGSAGGHNGIKDIIRRLGTEKFIRIRVGVGAKPKDWDLADFVLGHFSDSDRELVDEGINDAAEAVEMILSEGVDAAMNKYNRKKPGKSIHQMDLLGLHASGNIKNSAVCATALFYFLKLCKTLQRMQKCFHTNLNS